MGPDTLKHLFGLMIPILGLCIPIIAIIGGVRLKMRRDQLTHETMRQFAERGLPVPPEILATLRPADDSGMLREWSPQKQLRFGVINIAIGLGLGVVFLAMSPNNWLWTVGAIPLLIGVAMVLLWRLEQLPGQKRQTPGEPQ